MRLFKCNAQMTLTIVELPRPAWKVLPPRKLAVVATVVLIIVTAVVWSLL